MKKPTKFIKVDYWIQSILLILFALTFWFFWGLLLLIPLGAWQLLSATILIAGFQDRKRIYYLIAVAVYAIVSLVVYNMNFPDEVALSLIIPPPILGVWYYILTKRDYNSPETNLEEVEDILDSGNF